MVHAPVPPSATGETGETLGAGAGGVVADGDAGSPRVMVVGVGVVKLVVLVVETGGRVIRVAEDTRRLWLVRRPSLFDESVNDEFCDGRLVKVNVDEVVGWDGDGDGRHRTPMLKMMNVATSSMADNSSRRRDGRLMGYSSVVAVGVSRIVGFHRPSHG
jgi:hypothetical protein